MELAEYPQKTSFWEKLSVERIKTELLRTAFGHSLTFLSRFDPQKSRPEAAFSLPGGPGLSVLSTRVSVSLAGQRLQTNSV